jgi:dolichyl-phosphate beta-glucosyltransferase
MLAATGEYRLFSDADGSTPIDELAKLWARFEDGADIAIGSRALPDSDIETHQPWYRENMGRAFNGMLRTLGLTQFHDTQCGFKAFTGSAAELVFSRQTLDGFAFDAEILYIAQLHGLRVDEIPVRWINCPHTRVNAFTDSARMFAEMLQIRQNAWRGAYR